MQTLTSGYRGISLLLNLNWDRLIALLTIGAALLLGAFLAGL